MIESAITRRHEGGLLVKLGNHRLTVPVATIMLGVLTALGTAYQVVANDRSAILARIEAQERMTVDLSRKLELEQVVLSEIRTQLARIDARVAEVQVTLMRASRP
jgi:Tfp pilus assembly protein PilO